MPLGSYRIITAHGDLWFGEKELFGDDTEFNRLHTKDDGEIVHFYIDKKKKMYMGKTLTLERTAGGNALRTRIDRKEFENN